MKKRNGFTLIELLAVIVILAIIALIATPIILNVINDARKSAAKDSAYGYIDAIETQNQLAILDSEKYSKIESGDVTSLNSRVNVKGSKPTSGNVTIEKGQVTSATLCINGYTVTYDGKDATVGNSCNDSNNNQNEQPQQSTSGPTKVAPQAGETHKGIVYMDPTDLTVTCNESNSVSTTGTKTGCMKFYIFDDSGNDYKMILDHNTTANVAYETSGTYKEYEQASIKSTVDSDTTGWVGSPRLITANEVATITNTTTFDGSNSTWFYFNGIEDNKQTQASSSRGDNEYAWLFDYTNGCESFGCNIADESTYGYWTSSPVSGYSYGAWNVSRDGDLDYRGVDDVDFANAYGVRPVITLSKSEFSS